MKIVQLQQGSPAWHAHRARYFNASDAPAMMGCSPYKTRAQLLREVHTGLTGEIDASTQRVFDAGHRFEALARPLAERIIGDDLYPCVGVDRRYSASFDGLTLGGEIAWEHKTLNDALRALLPDASQCEAGQPMGELPLHYRVQMEHQCLVSNAGRVLFTASRWADDGELIEARHCWYYADATLRGLILLGWDQFAADLATYAPPAIAEPARAEPMESLPAVAVRLDGALTVAGNLPSFTVALRAFIDRMPARPTTDTDFATTDAACKALKRAEEALDAAEAGALASITDVEAMRRAVADCRKLARDTRLAAEKLVERRKVEIKEQAVQAARRALDGHIAGLNAELAPMRLLPVAADFPGCIKGLRSIASMQDALDTALAGGKIAADQQARGIRANLAAFHAAAAGLEFLFADLGQIVHKAADDFAAVLDARIAKHRADEAEKARRAADQQARLIAEAERRAREQEAARIAEQQRQQAEAERQAAAALAAAAAPAPVAPPPVSEPARPAPQPMATHAAPQLVRAETAPAAPEPATLSLGTICGRLGFTVSGDFLRDALHIAPARTDKRAMLYTERQFGLICQQLQSHISAMAELYSGEVA